MTSSADVCNRALGSIGARANISNLTTDTTPAATQCRLYYDVSRQRLLRAAPWGFARRTVILAELGRATDVPNIVPYPWLVSYAYPSDCLKFRYVLPPPVPPTTDTDTPNVSSTALLPWCPPSRQWRFLPSYTRDGDGNTAKVLISNVLDAYGVYTADVQDPDLWDQLFMNALEAVLAYCLVMPLTGNVGMKTTYLQLAKDAINEARAVDGNEAVPSTDHVVDWIAGRNAAPLMGAPLGGTFDNLGYWYDGYDLNWGM